MLINTCDSVAMCTNMKASAGLDLITLALDSYVFKIKQKLPTQKVVTGIKILLEHNVLQFRGNFLCREKLGECETSLPACRMLCTLKYWKYHCLKINFKNKLFY